MNKNIEIQSSVDKVGTAVTALTATEIGIAQLTTKYKDVVYDCKDAKQMKAAKDARVEIREPRYNIEALRKAAKAPVLALGRDIQTLAADLTARVLALETPIHEQIKTEEDRVAAAKQIIVDAENARISAQQERIVNIRDNTSDLIAKGFASSMEIGAAIAEMKKHPVDDSFEEFQDDAQSAWDASLQWLDDVYAKTVVAEEATAAAAEQARKDKEAQAELERDNAARQKALDEQQEKMEAQQRKLDKQAEDQRKEAEAARLAADAEQKRKDEERQEELDKQAEAQQKRDKGLATAQKKIDDENARITKDEADRKARKESDERAEAQRKADAEAAAEKAVYPGDDAIADALMSHFGVPEEVARKWINHIQTEQK